MLGAVQVPADGQPLVFLADHPTTGGYPVIAVVDPADLPLLAQARPGTRAVQIAWRWISTRISARASASGGSATTRPCSTLVTSANVACGFHAGDAVHHAPGLRRRGRPRRRGRRPGRLPRPGRFRPPAHRRTTSAELRDEIIYQIAALDGVLPAAGRPGPLRQAARRALQHRRRRRRAGGRGRGGRRGLRPAAAGAVPARLRARRLAAATPGCGWSPRASPTGRTARRHAGPARPAGRGDRPTWTRWSPGRCGWPRRARSWRSTARCIAVPGRVALRARRHPGRGRAGPRASAPR